MTGEITRRNVLLECLEHFRGLKKLCSKEHKGLEPAEGEEDLFYMLEKKCRIMQELIQAYESEPVRKALADWQNEVMKHGAPENIQKEFDDPDPVRYAMYMETSYTAPEGTSLDDPINAADPLAAYAARDEKEKANGHTAIYMPGDQEAWPVPGGENPGKL